jgi:hypothetical protein
MPDPRMLLFDIETAPILGYVWKPWDDSLVAIVEDWFLLSVAWQWYGEPHVRVMALPDFPLYETEPHNDRELAALIHALLDEAEVVVAHNSRFDTTKSMARFAIHGMTPPSPWAEIDTLKIARKNFAFTKNRLSDLAQNLQITHKTDPGGIKTWLGCLDGDAASWETMKHYNQNDVTVLRELYEKLRPWAKVPNMANLTSTFDACPKCGVAGRMVKRGWKNYAVTRRQQFCCGSCGGYSLSRLTERLQTKYTQ